MSHIGLADPAPEDFWVSLCGNRTIADGFYPCNEQGNQRLRRGRPVAMSVTAAVRLSAIK